MDRTVHRVAPVGCGCCAHCQCTGLCADRSRDDADQRSAAASPTTTPIRRVPPIPAPAVQRSFDDQRPLSPSGPAGPADGSKKLLEVVESLPHPNDLIFGRKSHRPRPPSPDALTPMLAPSQHKSAFAALQRTVSSQSNLTTMGSLHKLRAPSRQNSPLSIDDISGAAAMSFDHIDVLGAAPKSRSASRKVSPRHNDDDDSDDFRGHRLHPEKPSLTRKGSDREYSSDLLSPDHQTPKPSKPSSLRPPPQHEKMGDIDVHTWAPTPVLGTFDDPKNRKELDQDSDADSADSSDKERRRERERRKHLERKSSTKHPKSHKTSSRRHRDSDSETSEANSDMDGTSSNSDREHSREHERRHEKERERARREHERQREKEEHRKREKEAQRQRDKEEQVQREKDEQRKRDKEDERKRERDRERADREYEEQRQREKDEKKKREKEERRAKEAEVKARLRRKDSKRSLLDKDDNSDREDLRRTKTTNSPSDSSPPAYLSRAPTPSMDAQQSHSHGKHEQEPKSITIGGYTLTKTRSRQSKPPKGESGSASLVSPLSSIARKDTKEGANDGGGSGGGGPESKRDRLLNYLDSVVSAAVKDTTHDNKYTRLHGVPKPEKNHHALSKGSPKQAQVQMLRSPSPPPYRTPSRQTSGQTTVHAPPLYSMQAISKLVVRHSTTQPNTIHFVDMSCFDDDGGPLVAFRLQGIGMGEVEQTKKNKNAGQRGWIFDSLEQGRKVQGEMHLGIGRQGPILFEVHVKRRQVDRYVIQGVKDQGSLLSNFSDAPHWGEHDDYRHLYCRSPQAKTMKWYMQEPGKMMRLYGRGDDDYGHVYVEARTTGGPSMTGAPVEKSRKKKAQAMNGNGREHTLIFYARKEDASAAGDGKDLAFVENGFICATWWCARQTYDEGQVAAAHAEIEMIENIEKAFEVDLLAGA